MRIARKSDANVEAVEQGQFSGPVTRQDLGRIPSPDAAALIVTFRDGARTGWHRHDAGQVMFVLEGSGRACARDKEPVAIAPGDMVYAAPGEEHWHGAAPGSSLTHFALSFGESDWLGAVED